MNEIDTLILVTKKHLKRQGVTYRELSMALGLSEASVKRMFSTRRFTLDRLVQISDVLGLTLAELTQEATSCQAQVKTLTERQETLLVSDTSLLLTAVCALNHWRIQDIVAAYRMTEAECLQRLLQLDRIGLIELLPGNRIRLKVARDFDWLPDGPIKRFFRTQEKDFLNSHFEDADDAMSFVHGMFTEEAITQLSQEVKRFRRRFAELHEESLPAPLSRKHGVSSLLVTRRGWEPAAFLALRRKAGRHPAELRRP